MKPRETGGNVPGKKKVKVKAKPFQPPKPEVAKVAPQRKGPKRVAPEATRPVTPKQRKEIDRRVGREQYTYKLKKKAAAENKKDAPTKIQQASMGVPKPIVQAATTSGGTAMKVLEQTTRPLHAISGAAMAGARNGTDLKAIGRGALRGLENKDRYSYSDVLGELGVKNKIVKYGVGTAVDVLGDPTTYLTAGALAPAKVAARKAAEETALKVAKTQAKSEVRAVAGKGAARKGAARKGESQAQADARIAAERENAARGLAAKKAQRTEAASPHQNKGITIGIGKKRTSGKLTSTISRKVGISATAKNIRKGNRVISGEAKVRPKGEGPIVEDVVGAVHPGYRPSGVPEHAHNTIRSAEAERRSAVANAERRLARLAKSFKKEHSPEDYAQIVDAIESGTVGALRRAAPHLHDAAVRLRSEFRNMDRLDRQAGIRAGSRKNYVAHVKPGEAETTLRAGRPARGGGSAKTRTIDKRIAELRDEHPDLFSSDIPTILAKRGPETIKGVADVKLMRELVNTGRKFVGNVGEGEAVFHVPAKSSVPKKLTDKEVRSLEKGKRQNGQYVVLNEKLADRTLTNAARPELTGIRLRYRRAHGKVKTVLTMPMPSYHLRNAQGDISNASYNLNAKELGSSLNQSRKVLKVRREMRRAEGSLTPGAAQKFVSGESIKIGGQDVPVEHLIREAEQVGAVGTGFSRELRAMAGEAEKGKESRFRNLGQGREDWVRMATYIGARKQGFTAREAAARVRETHFDYADLTTSERGIRDVMPFYTFAARNTPLQAKTLLRRPGKLARYQKLVEEGAKASGIPPEDLHNYLQDYERIGLGIPAFGLRVGGLPLQLLPGSPATDLNRLTLNPVEQAKQIASMVTIYKSVPEAIFNYSLFFRNQIDQGTKVPAPDWIGNVPLSDGMKRELGLIHIYDDRLKRKTWKWKAKWDYLLKQLPESSFALGITTAAKNRRGQGVPLKLLSLSGVRPQPIDKLSVDLDKAYEKQTALGHQIKELNKAGVKADAVKSGTVPAQAKHLIPQYNRLIAKQHRAGEMIYNLTLLQQKRGDLVRLPKTGGPKKIKATSLITQSSGPSVNDILGHSAPTVNDILGQ